MTTAAAPLALNTALTSWTVDATSVLSILVVGGGYAWCCRSTQGHRIPTSRRWCFGFGIVIWAVAAMSAVEAYAHILFWVRALQVLLLLFVVPFLLAMGTPLTALCNTGAGPRVNRLLASGPVRVLTHPATTSALMLATPWLLYLTRWYVAALERPVIGAITRIVLIVVGFGYFYARVQADPVPRRYPQLISVVISIVETLGDGVLGIVLWLGPLVAVGYYARVGRTWGPSPRVDQSIGAGVLWILGDVLGIPFLIVLMRAMSSDEKERAKVVDVALDTIDDETPAPALWWENDPQLHDRFRHR